jgi:hypothetical protein
MNVKCQALIIMNMHYDELCLSPQFADAIYVDIQWISTFDEGENGISC